MPDVEPCRSPSDKEPPLRACDKWANPGMTSLPEEASVLASKDCSPLPNLDLASAIRAPLRLVFGREICSLVHLMSLCAHEAQI